MSVRVTELAAAAEGRWKAFVDAHPAATFFHALEWRDLLLRTFRHRARYLMAEEDGRTVGVLPLVSIRSMFFGRSVVSVPFGVYGGVVSESEAATRALVEGAREVAAEAGAGYVELRQLERAPGLDLPGTDLYCTFTRELPADPAACLEMLPRKARAEARKALARPEVTVEVGELRLDEFYRLFAANKRKLGSPVFPKSLFLNLRNILGPRLVSTTIRKDGEAVAAVLSFLFRDTYMAYYSGAVDAANEVSANNLMYHVAMKDAVERGLRRFDFGRSRRDTGAFAFKKNQGFEPSPLPYQYILRDGASVPSINASNPRYNLAKRLFRRLPPVVAEKLGSFVAKRMPV